MSKRRLTQGGDNELVVERVKMKRPVLKQCEINTTTKLKMQWNNNNIWSKGNNQSYKWF